MHQLVEPMGAGSSFGILAGGGKFGATSGGGGGGELTQTDTGAISKPWDSSLPDPQAL
jgi:hypothetical protein